ncbi:hypothetical protein F9874_03415 [Glaesserella parasuis]|uniref:hypothetical protein n=1 Tax=Glaesserella parasuis TaxID=738 RepID=UPI0013282D96|nr:hypothetical protein [Glaesserella parasuis]MWP99415.1 hypothetical protein [Glaesserella parasuis]MWQ44679.1 hypothetical protein [Glaesserella parasuis]MWQ61339.1 hypothetical protein [Glaesserella parasuis]
MSQSDFIYAVIPSEYQSFFKIETNLNPTEEVIYSLEAFGEAVKRPYPKFCVNTHFNLTVIV